MMITYTYEDFLVLLFVFCLIKTVLHGFKINIFGISMNRYYYDYNASDENMMKEWHKCRFYRCLIILILDAIALLISYMFDPKTAVDFLLIAVIIVAIIACILQKFNK